MWSNTACPSRGSPRDSIFSLRDFSWRSRCTFGSVSAFFLPLLSRARLSGRDRCSWEYCRIALSFSATVTAFVRSSFAVTLSAASSTTMSSYSAAICRASLTRASTSAFSGPKSGTSESSPSVKSGPTILGA